MKRKWDLEIYRSLFNHINIVLDIRFFRSIESYTNLYKIVFFFPCPFFFPLFLSFSLVFPKLQFMKTSSFFIFRFFICLLLCTPSGMTTLACFFYQSCTFQIFSFILAKHSVYDPYVQLQRYECKRESYYIVDEYPNGIDALHKRIHGYDKLDAQVRINK